MIALICSLVATYLAYAHLEELEARAMNPVEMGMVVVASTDIPKGTFISQDMVEKRPIPINAIASRAVQEIDQVLGKIAIADLTQGEQIIETRVGYRADVNTFVDRVSSELRAVTINVNEDSTFSGLLRPGDRVDIIGTFNEYGSTERRAYTYISNVEVLAVGDEYRLYTSSNTDKSQDSLFQFQPSSRARTVTLALTPEDAELIVLLEQHGYIKFALRSPDAVEPVEEEHAEEELSHKVPEKIEVIRGTKFESVPFEL